MARRRAYRPKHFERDGMEKKEVKSNSQNSPFGLQVSIDNTNHQVYFDKTDTTGRNQMVIRVDPIAARKLAKFILKNTEKIW